MTITQQSDFRLIGESDPPVLPVFPWRRSSSRYTVPTSDSYGFMSALNTALTTEGVYWGVNFYDGSGGAQSLEIKRIGSPPSGELTTARAYYYGSASGIGSGITDGDANVFNIVYLSLCLDANTSSSGPPTSFTTADPYGSFLYNSKGFQACPATLSSSSSLWFAESEIGLMWSMSNGNPATATAARFGFFGLLWDDFTGTPGWAMLADASASSLSYPLSAADVYPVRGCGSGTPGTATRIIGMKNGSSTRYDLGRAFDGPCAAGSQDGSPFYGGSSAVLQSVFLGQRVRGSGGVYDNGGMLRQFRYGPSVLDNKRTLDGAIEQTFTMAGSAAGTLRPTIHLDQVRP